MHTKHTLDVAKKEVYTAVMTAPESKLQKFTADLQSESGRMNCFRIARHMAREVVVVCHDQVRCQIIQSP